MIAVQYALRGLFALLGAGAIVISCRMNMAALDAIGGKSAGFIAAVAVMTAAVKAGVPVYADHFRAGRRELWAVFALAIAFDVLCVLGFAAMTRGAAVDEATAKGRNVAELSAAVARIEAAEGQLDAELQSGIQRARQELDRLNDASRAQKFVGRASYVLAPLIVAARDKAGDCGGRGHVDSCQALQRLLSEEQDAKAREDAARRIDGLEGQMAEARRAANTKIENARAKLAAAERAPGVVDPAAFAMRELAGLAGFELPEAWAGKVFQGVLVLLIELLAVIGLKAALHPEEVQTCSRKEETRTREKQNVHAIDVPPVAAPTPQPTPQTPSAGNGGALLAWLEASGGEVVTSYRKAGAAIGVSAATANTTAQRLQAQGLISISAGPGGTSLKILSRQLSTQTGPMTIN